MNLSLKNIIAFLVVYFFVSSLSAQSFLIKGVVYDSSRNYPLEAVSVLSSAGAGTITNAEGYYEIRVTDRDSIWFSYLNKPTVKFPVIKIVNPMQFDIYHRLPIERKAEA